MNNRYTNLRGSLRKRKYTVIAQDPSFSNGDSIFTSKIEVPAEDLCPGPCGSRISVIDYDSRTSTLYKPFEIGKEDTFIGVTDRKKLVENQEFHSQNVYAISMSVLLKFESSLGRYVSWGFENNAHQLKIAPHAFYDANAFYSRKDQGLFFGYFKNKNNEWVFTCLSHDIVVHEVTHALIDGLKPFFDRPSSPDQAAFHEGFADVIAILTSLSQEIVIDYALEKNNSDVFELIHENKIGYQALRKSCLFKLAKEFGSSIEPYNHEALRESLEIIKNKNCYTNYRASGDPHKLGELLVASIMDAFLKVWVERIKPIIGTVSRLADRARVIEEGAKAARHLSQIVIRALDYLPPTDILFSDFLSGIITADVELYNNDDTYNYRKKLLESFSSYGIEPKSKSNKDEYGQWDYPKHKVVYGYSHFDQMKTEPEAVNRFIWENRKALELLQGAFTRVKSLKPVFRTSNDGFVLRETNVELIQTIKIQAKDLKSLKLTKPDGMPSNQELTIYGSNTLIFDEYGHLKYNIGCGIRDSKEQSDRIKTLWENNQLNSNHEHSFSIIHRNRMFKHNYPNSLEGW